MKRTIVTTGLAMMIVCVARDASAVMNPGLSCKYYGKQGNDTYFDPNGYTANGLKNVDTSARYVVCPLATPQEAVDELSIILSTSADVCKVYQKDNADLSQTIWSRTSTWTFVGGTVLHTFNIGQEGFYYGRNTWTLYCNLPAGAVIREFDMWTTPL